MKKKITLLVLFVLFSCCFAFAGITLPHTGIRLENVPSGGIWMRNDITETLRKSVGFIVDVKNDVVINAYRYPTEEGFDDEGIFFVLSEFSGMDFAFSWSAVRVMAFRNTRNEVEKFYKEHLGALGGTGHKIRKKDNNSKTGEYFYEYDWIDKNGNKVYGRSYGTYLNKETLITMTVEWNNPEQKEKAKRILDEYVTKLGITYSVNV